MKTIKTIAAVLAGGIILCGFVFLKHPPEPVPAADGGEKIRWCTFQQAVELSRKEKRKIFIDVYTDWCGWCKVMDRNTFANPVIAKYMNEKYYCVKLNAEMKDTVVFNNYTFLNPSPAGVKGTHQLASSLLDNKLGYPSTVFLDENFSRMWMKSGYLDPYAIEPVLKYFGDNAFVTTQWDEYQKNFKSELPPPPPPPSPVVPPN